MKLLFVLCFAMLAQQREPSAGTPAWSLSGVVKDGSGPLKGVWLTLTGPELAKSVRTDPQGRYSFTGVQPGVYSLRMQKPEDGGEPRSRTITLAPGQKIADFDVRVPKGAVIAGRVFDRDGEPLSGLTVIAFARVQDRGEPRLITKGGAVTDDAGAYRVAHLPEGSYVLAAVTTARKPLRISTRPVRPPVSLPPAYPPVTFAPGWRTPDGASLIEVRDGDVRDGVDIALRKEPVYCVSFRPEAGGIAADGKLEIGVTLAEWLGARGPVMVSASVPPGQDSQLCGLPAGDYRFGFLAYTRSPLKGYAYATAEVSVGKQHAELPPVSLPPLENITGKVTIRDSEPGVPLPDGMRILLGLRTRGIQPNDKLLAVVARDGSFSLTGVYPDRYSFRIENLPGGHYVAAMKQDGIDLRVQDVRSAGGTVSVELASDGPVLSGKVVTAGDSPAPLPEITVLLVARRTGEVLVAQADQAGMYRFSSGISPGDYRIAAVPDLPEWQRYEPVQPERFLSGAEEITLAARENRVLDLKVRRGSGE